MSPLTAQVAAPRLSSSSSLLGSGSTQTVVTKGVDGPRLSFANRRLPPMFTDVPMLMSIATGPRSEVNEDDTSMDGGKCEQIRASGGNHSCKGAGDEPQHETVNNIFDMDAFNEPPTTNLPPITFSPLTSPGQSIITVPNGNNSTTVVWSDDVAKMAATTAANVAAAANTHEQENETAAGNLNGVNHRKFSMDPCLN